MLVLPKKVAFENKYLEIIYYVLLLLVVTTIFAKFFISQHYLGEVPLWENAVIRVEVLDSNLVALKQSYDQLANTDICVNYSNYDYWRGLTDDQKYVNQQCIMPCDETNSSNCIMSQLTHRASGGDHVFLVSQGTTSLYSRTASSTRQSAFFLPTIKNVQIKIDFSTTVVVPNFLVGRTIGSVPSTSEAHLDGLQDFKLIITNGHGKVIKVFDPPLQELVFGISDIFELLGDKNFLYSRDSTLPSSLQPGSASGGPVRWVSGVEIIAWMNCWAGAHAQQAVSDSAGFNVDIGNNKGICYIHFSYITGVFVERSFIHVLDDDSLLEMTTHGILIRSKLTGFYRYVDGNLFFLNVMALLLVLKLPTMIIELFATRCLGPLSSVYKSVINTRFDIQEQIGGMTSRLMANSCAFVELSESSENGGGVLGKARLMERLRDVFRHRMPTASTDEPLVETHGEYSLDTNELLSFANFAFAAMHAKHEDPSVDLNIDQFMASCSSLEPLSFEQLVKLFDTTRRQGFLEKLFTPSKFTSALHRGGEVAKHELISSVAESSLNSILSLDVESLRERKLSMLKLRNEVKDIKGIVRRLESKILNENTGTTYLEEKLKVRLEELVLTRTDELRETREKVTELQRALSKVHSKVEEMLHIQSGLASQVLIDDCDSDDSGMLVGAKRSKGSASPSRFLASSSAPNPDRAPRAAPMPPQSNSRELSVPSVPNRGPRLASSQTPVEDSTSKNSRPSGAFALLSIMRHGKSNSGLE